MLRGSQGEGGLDLFSDQDAPDAARGGRGAEGRGFCPREPAGERWGRPDDGREAWLEPWHEVAARLCRVDDGLPQRMDEAGSIPPEATPERRKSAEAGRTHRLKALGNAIVPQIVYEILSRIP